MSLYDVTIPLDDDEDDSSRIGGMDDLDFPARPAPVPSTAVAATAATTTASTNKAGRLDFLADNTGSTDEDDDDGHCGGEADDDTFGAEETDEHDVDEDGSDADGASADGINTDANAPASEAERRTATLRHDVKMLEKALVKARLLMLVVDLFATGRVAPREYHGEPFCLSTDVGAMSDAEFPETAVGGNKSATIAAAAVAAASARRTASRDPFAVSGDEDFDRKAADGMTIVGRPWHHAFCHVDRDDEAADIQALERARKAGHAAIVGIHKLREKIAREVMAAASALAYGRSKLDAHLAELAPPRDETGGREDAKTSPVTAAAPTPPRGAQPYLKCNLLGYLEVFVLTIVCEPGVEAVCFPVRDRRTIAAPPLAPTGGARSARKKTPPPPKLSFGAATASGAVVVDKALEVDVVSCHGARWIKVKAFSEKNARQDVLGQSSERKHFAQAARSLTALSADAMRLAFGTHPEVVVATLLDLPQDLEQGFLDETRVASIRSVSHIAAVFSRFVDDLHARVPTAYELPLSETLLKHLQRMSNSCSDEALDAAKMGEVVHPRQFVDAGIHFVHCITNMVPRGARVHNVAPPLVTGTAVVQSGAQQQRRSHALPPLVGVPRGVFVFPPRGIAIRYINFDVTAMVAMVSDTCNGHAGTRLPKQRVLDEQMLHETHTPAISAFLAPTLREYTQILPQHLSAREAICAELEGFDPFADPADASSSRRHRIPPVQEICRHAVHIDESERVAREWFVEAEARQAGGGSGEALDPLAPWEEELFNLRRRQFGMQLCVNWVVTDVALSEFAWIVDTIAGEAELRRAKRLIKNLQVVPAGAFFPIDTAPSAAAAAALPPELLHLRNRSGVLGLADSGKIMFRHKAVFGIGELLNAVTLSANQQFVQAARDQGVEPCVRYHPSRALTERKRLGVDRQAGPRRPPEIYPSRESHLLEDRGADPDETD